LCMASPEQTIISSNAAIDKKGKDNIYIFFFTKPKQEQKKEKQYFRKVFFRFVSLWFETIVHLPEFLWRLCHTSHVLTVSQCSVLCYLTSKRCLSPHLWSVSHYSTVSTPMEIVMAKLLFNVILVSSLSSQWLQDLVLFKHSSLCSFGGNPM
jgi:hypothetical protein